MDLQTIGLFFLDYFLDRFFGYVFGPFLLPNISLDHFMGGGEGGNTPLVLREWWDAVNQYLGRGEK